MTKAELLIEYVDVLAEMLRLTKENERLQKHIDNMSCCCAGCTKHNQDLSENLGKIKAEKALETIKRTQELNKKIKALGLT